jgi:Fe-S-cluster containining protein
MKNNFDFKCVRCGHCCRNEGSVRFSDNEIIYIADYIGVNPRELKERYLSFTSAGYVHHVLDGQQCAFLRKNICSINSVKPNQCRTFPYWKEYIGEDGNLINFNRSCNGMSIKVSIY